MNDPSIVRVARLCETTVLVCNGCECVVVNAVAHSLICPNLPRTDSAPT